MQDWVLKLLLLIVFPSQADVVSAKSKSLEKEVKLLTAENERLLRANQALQRHQKYVADNLNVTASPSIEADQREFVIRKRQRE